MSIFPIPYRIQSVNTKFFAISKPDDKNGQEVDTKNGKDSIPDDSILFTNAPIGGGSKIVEIIGVGPSRLYVSLKEGDTKLTWSDEKFLWVVNDIGEDKYVIIPANGGDLYWFDEFNVGIGDHIAVRPGSDVKPPQNEWFITPA